MFAASGGGIVGCDFARYQDAGNGWLQIKASLFKETPVEELLPGMVLGQDVLDNGGRLIVGKGRIDVTDEAALAKYGGCRHDPGNAAGA